ncbi:MAG: hypothetical protein KF836_13425 [Fimbriimonadaceae bacterium]|nr:hypothetical protein [Fimbriimonadaceae bacterium]
MITLKWKMCVVASDDSFYAEQVKSSFHSNIPHIATTKQYEELCSQLENDERLIVIVVDSDYWWMLQDDGDRHVLIHLGEESPGQCQPFGFVEAFWNYWKIHPEKLKKAILAEVEESIGQRIKID